MEITSRPASSFPNEYWVSHHRGKLDAARHKTVRHAGVTIRAVPWMTVGLALLAAAALAMPAWVVAADAIGTPQSRYHAEMAICDSGRSNQDVATCRIEARNALASSRSGSLSDAPGEYEGNAAQRCEALVGVDFQACLARMRGEGSMEGSVSSGGLLRENVTIVPAR